MRRKIPILKALKRKRGIAYVRQATRAIDALVEITHIFLTRRRSVQPRRSRAHADREFRAAWPIASTTILSMPKWHRHTGGTKTCPLRLIATRGSPLHASAAAACSTSTSITALTVAPTVRSTPLRSARTPKRHSALSVPLPRRLPCLRPRSCGRPACPHPMKRQRRPTTSMPRLSRTRCRSRRFGDGFSRGAFSLSVSFSLSRMASICCSA